MNPSIDITTEQRKTLLALLRRFIPGVAVWAYGSRVKWTARPNSDLDLVAFTAPEQSNIVSELKEALAESDLPFLVDFHVWDEVPERFHAIIRKEYVVLQEVGRIQENETVTGEYPITRISDLADSISETHKMQKEQLIFLNTSDILHGKILHRRYSAVKDWPGQAKKSIRKNDILFSEIRPANGRWAFVEEEADDYVVSTKLMVIRARSDRVFPKFLYQYLTSAEITSWLQHLAESRSGTFPQITFDEVASLELQLPPLPKQKDIAHIIGTLNDKIELNWQMNATLEAMAQTLFQSWFVDFDHVRAKLDGHQPVALDAATAALFPDHFQESPHGHIPQGWTVEPVGEVVECVGGGTPSTAESKFWVRGTHHWTTPKDFSSLQAPILLDTDRKITDAGVAKISSGLLPAGTLLLSSRAPVGYLAIAAMPVAINQGFIAIKCNERASNYFMLNWCQTNMAEIESRATGTTFAEISKTNFRPILMVLPPKELMAAFAEKVAPLYAQITSNLKQSRTLATIRDALLPKLLSGELRVRETDASIEVYA